MQLDALAIFCDLRQLIVNLSKTKVVVLEGKRSGVQDFMFSGGEGGQLQVSWVRLSGRPKHGIWSSFLVAAARKALFVMQWRWAGHQGSCITVQVI